MDEMTVAQVARVLCLTQSRVRELVREGKLAGDKHGGRKWRIPRTAVEAYEHGGAATVHAEDTVQGGIGKQLATQTEQAPSKAEAGEERAENLEFSRLKEHCEELAEIIKVLAHHVARMLRFKDDDNVEALPGVFPPTFWYKPSGRVVSEGTDPLEEFTYQQEHPVEPYLGNLVFLHYEHMFGKLPFPTWENIAMENVSPQLLDNLKFMAYGGLKCCPTCPICQQMGSLVP